MTAYTDFHYSPTGSGVISGAQVLEQTEQGINGLGQYVQDNVSGAIDVANEALTTAQSADSNATTAINLANSFNAQIIAANQTAGNALTTAQSAQNTANSASSLATTANNNAATALNTANSASAGVTALTGTVNSLGNRMTAAENNISTNAGNITTLQNNLATTNANVTAAANAASSAQATATSAQSTATLARNQAYVLRYTGTTITGGGTIAYADVDNTDNIKAGDKIIDISGAIYDIASVDTVNQTVTVGATEIINLAVLPDLFNSANTWSKAQTYSDGNAIVIKNNGVEIGNEPSAYNEQRVVFNDKNGYGVAAIKYQNQLSSSNSFINGLEFSASDKFKDGVRDPTGTTTTTVLRIGLWNDGTKYIYNEGRWRSNLLPFGNNTNDVGSSSYQWNNLYAKKVNTQSVNGINPGALSLPDLSVYQNIDTNGWVYDGIAMNNILLNSGDTNVTKNGWLYVRTNGTVAGDRIAVRLNFIYAEYPTIIVGELGFGHIELFVPLVAGYAAYIFTNKSPTYVRFYPCLGNVPSGV